MSTGKVIFKCPHCTTRAPLEVVSIGATITQSVSSLDPSAVVETAIGEDVTADLFEVDDSNIVVHDMVEQRFQCSFCGWVISSGTCEEALVGLARFVFRNEMQIELGAGIDAFVGGYTSREDNVVIPPVK